MVQMRFLNARNSCNSLVTASAATRATYCCKFLGPCAEFIFFLPKKRVMDQLRQHVRDGYLVSALRKAFADKSSVELTTEAQKFEEAAWSAAQKTYTRTYVELINRAIQRIHAGALLMIWQYGETATLDQVSLEQAADTMHAIIKMLQDVYAYRRELALLRQPLDPLLEKEKAQQQVAKSAQKATDAMKAWFTACSRLDPNASELLTKWTTARAEMEQQSQAFGTLCEKMRKDGVVFLPREQQTEIAQCYEAKRLKMFEHEAAFKALHHAYFELRFKFSQCVEFALRVTHFYPYPSPQPVESLAKYTELTDEAPNKRAKTT